MADLTKTINFVSPEKLAYYDSKSKVRMQEAIEAARAALQQNIDAANTAVETEKTRAMAAEATNALAAQNAQTDVDNLEAYVGTFTPSEGVDTVVKYIDAKTAGIASDAALKELEERVGQNETDIEALEKLVGDNETDIENKLSGLAGTVAENEADIEGKMTALTARVAANETAVGTTLPNAITAEETARKEADTAINEALAAVKEDVDAFFKDADMTENAKDTLKELQAYIASDESGASEMLASIKQNADDIDALEKLVGSKAVATQIQEAIAAENLDQYATDEDLADAIERIVELEKVDHEHANKALLDTYTQTEADLADAVAKKHEHANKAELDLIQSGDKAKWDAAEGNAIAHANALDEAMDKRMDVVEAAIAEGGDTAKAIAAAHEAANKAQEEVDALEGTHATDKAALEAADKALADRATALEEDVADLLAVEHVEITNAEIDAMFEEATA